MLGAELGYPALKNGKREVVNEGQERWLAYARAMGHQHVGEALKLAKLLK